MRKLLFLITLLLILSSCKSSEDELYKADSELIDEGGYAYIVKILDIKETVQETYFDGTVPKTIFNAECIYAIVGECKENLVINRMGGYSEDTFIGVTGEEKGIKDLISPVYDGEMKNNLYHENEYYLVILKEDGKEMETLRYYHLYDYYPQLGPLEQEGFSGRFIWSICENWRIYNEEFLSTE